MINKIVRSTILAFALFGAGSFVEPFIYRFVSNVEVQEVTGSAWVLNEDGYIVTAHHVVDGRTKFRVSYNGTFIDATLITVDPKHDIAILHINTPTPNYLPLQLNYQDKEQAIAYGYPRPDLYGDSLKVAPGRLENSIFTAEYSFRGRTCPGNSGGPVVATSGVVGVVTQGVSPFDPYECSNQAVGPLAHFIEELAKSSKIQVHISTIPFIKSVTDNEVLQIYAW